MRKLNMVFAGLLLATACHGAEAAKLYRWVDDEGNVHYTDKIPAQYADQARKQLSEQGFVVDSKEAAPTPEELAAARAKLEAEKQARRKRQAQQRIDQVLLTSYHSVADIERARDAEIEGLQRAMGVNATAIDSRIQYLHDLVDRAAERQRAGLPVSEEVTQAMAKTRAEIIRMEGYIAKKRAEQAEVYARYEQRIARFKELTK